MDYTLGTQIADGWIIVREIGEGSFGKVFEIQKNHNGVTNTAALKVVRVPRSVSDYRAALADGMDEKSATTYFNNFVQEINREVAIMISMKGHPNIVTCEDHWVEPHVGYAGSDVLIRMELLTPLNDFQLNHPMNEETVRRLGMELCEALVLCQKRGLIHRDIKPENIFVGTYGQFKLGDFGIARTASKTVGALSRKGTESYMAPEVYIGKKYGQSVDIYSLGLVLYKFMNRNRLPFYPPYPEAIGFEDKENAMLERIKGTAIPAPVDASPAFADVILKACAYEPEDRFASADELLTALRNLPPPRSGKKAESAPPDHDQSKTFVDAPYVAGEKTRVESPEETLRDPVREHGHTPEPGNPLPPKKTPVSAKKQKKSGKPFLWIAAIVCAVVLCTQIFQRFVDWAPPSKQNEQNQQIQSSQQSESAQNSTTPEAAPESDSSIAAPETLQNNDNASAGIGVTIRISEETNEIVVLDVLQGGPAEEAGIRSGDILKSVDGTMLAGLSIEEITSLVHGEPDTVIEIVVDRGEATMYNFPVTRRILDTTAENAEEDLAISEEDRAMQQAWEHVWLQIKEDLQFQSENGYPDYLNFNMTMTEYGTYLEENGLMFSAKDGSYSNVLNIEKWDDGGSIRRMIKAKPGEAHPNDFDIVADTGMMAEDHERITTLRFRYEPIDTSIAGIELAHRVAPGFCGVTFGTTFEELCGTLGITQEMLDWLFVEENVTGSYSGSTNWHDGSLRIFRYIDGEETGDNPFHYEHFAIYDNTVQNGALRSFGFTISFDKNGPSLLSFDLEY